MTRQHSGTRPISPLFLFAILFSLAWILPASGQPSGGSPTSTGTTSSGNAAGSFYDYSKAGDVPMSISIWGFVRSPGRYRVPSYTKLLELISLAGGPTERAKLDQVKVVHDLTIDSAITEPSRMFNLDEYQISGNPQLNPVLTHNDIIIIPGDAINDLNEILSIVSSVAMVALSVLGLIFAFSRN